MVGGRPGVVGGYLCPLFECQNLLFRVLRKSCRCQNLLLYLHLSLTLSQFQAIFVSFVAISAVLCPFLRPCRLSEFTLTWPLCCVLQVKSSTTLLHMEE